MTSLRSAAIIATFIASAGSVFAGGIVLPNPHLQFPPEPEVSQIECSPSTIFACEE